MRDQTDMVAELLGLFEDVGREENRLAARLEIADQVLEQRLRDRIEARERLVEDQDVGVVEDRADELDLLLHALRQRLDLRLGPLSELDAFEPLADQLLGAPTLDSVQLGEEQQMVGDGHLAVEAAFFRQVADSAQVLRPPRPAEEEHLAAVRRENVHDHADAGRLAGAVLAQQTEYGSRRHRQGDAVDRHKLTVRLAHIAQFEIVAHAGLLMDFRSANGAYATVGVREPGAAGFSGRGLRESTDEGRFSRRRRLDEAPGSVLLHGRYGGRLAGRRVRRSAVDARSPSAPVRTICTICTIRRCDPGAQSRRPRRQGKDPCGGHPAPGGHAERRGANPSPLKIYWKRPDRIRIETRDDGLTRSRRSTARPPGRPIRSSPVSRRSCSTAPSAIRCASRPTSSMDRPSTTRRRVTTSSSPAGRNSRHRDRRLEAPAHDRAG